MSERDRDRPRLLTQDEADLWAYAMRDAARLNRLNGAEASNAREAPPDAPSKPANGAVPPDKREPSVKPPEHAPLKPKPARKGPPPIGDLDRRQTRLIATGRAAIDARLDLHGMRQDEAHGALRAFLVNAQSRGAKVVLVITGKGGKRRENAGGWPRFEEETGVLRRLVPLWLQEPDLRQMIVSCGASDARHGGGGALYIRLRKNVG